jgi:hypothetical protein
MSPILLAVMEKNWSDVETIIATIGLDNIRKILPNIMNILRTVQATNKLTGPATSEK